MRNPVPRCATHAARLALLPCLPSSPPTKITGPRGYELVSSRTITINGVKLGAVSRPDMAFILVLLAAMLLAACATSQVHIEDTTEFNSVGYQKYEGHATSPKVTMTAHVEDLVSKMRLAVVDGWDTDPALPAKVALTRRDDDKATAYVFREWSIWGSALKRLVYCDDVELARLQNGRYFRVRLEPGYHVFRAERADYPAVSVDAKPGDVHFVQMFIYEALFIFNGGLQYFDQKAVSSYAWAVHAGDVGAVPVPAAAWLFGSGLLGLIGVARRKTA